MKKIVFMLAVFVCLNVQAVQRTCVVQVRDGQANLAQLEQLLSQGWKVVSATPIQASNSFSVVGKPQQAYTCSIVYVLNKD